MKLNELLVLMLSKVLKELGSSQVVLKKGESLFLQGDDIVKFFYLKKGKMKLVKNTLEGDESLIYVAFPHETFAEASLFSDCYHCSAIALVESEVLVYKKSEFFRYLENKPAVMVSLLKIFSQQVRDLRTINEIKNIRSASERVLFFLKSQVDSNNEVLLKISLKDTAYKIGLAHETFYRELKKLEQSKLLQRRGSFFKLL